MSRIDSHRAPAPDRGPGPSTPNGSGTPGAHSLPTAEQTKLARSYRRILWICGPLGLVCVGMLIVDAIETSKTYPYQDISVSVFYDVGMALALVIPAGVAWVKRRTLKRYVDAGTDQMPRHMKQPGPLLLGLGIAMVVVVVPTFVALAASGVREAMVSDVAREQARTRVQQDAAFIFEGVERTDQVCQGLTRPNYRRGFQDALTERAQEWKSQSHDYDFLSAAEVADILMVELDKICGITT